MAHYSIYNLGIVYSDVDITCIDAFPSDGADQDRYRNQAGLKTLSKAERFQNGYVAWYEIGWFAKS